MFRLPTLTLLALSVGPLACAGMPEDLPQYSAFSTLLHTSGQPQAATFNALRQAGIRAVIDLRPPSERPEFDERSVAQAAGLTYESLPVEGRGGLTRENVVAFDALLKKHAQEQTLAHCSSGNRVGALMALRAAWLDGKSMQEALAIGERAGLKGMKADVEAVLRSPPPAVAAP